MNPEHLPEFEDLAARLRAIANDRPLLFFINPGNWGDSLIREGAEMFLRHYEFAYRSVRFKDILKGRTDLATEIAATHHRDPVMVYNGNGAFSSHYTMLEKVAELSQSFSTAVMLPATYAAAIDRSAFTKDSHFFVRDRFQSADAMPDCSFCHDMAFFLNPVASEPVRERGDFMRDDVEKPEGAELPKGNLDLSKKGRAHTPVDGFLEQIGACREVHTNRLHVGIGAALLGRTTYLANNDYFKIRAIYESSLKGFFPDVHFSAEQPG